MKAEVPKMPAGLKDLKFNSFLIQEVVEVIRANARQNTASAKTRGEKSGGGKKPWRQKGTGRARHGSTRSPIWKGGGVTHGPTTLRNLKKDIPRKKKQLATLQIIARKIKEKRVAVVDEIKIKEVKTRSAADFLNKTLGKDYWGRVLILTEKKDVKLLMAFRNIPGVMLKAGINFNAYELLYYETILFTKSNWENFIKARGIK